MIEPTLEGIASALEVIQAELWAIRKALSKSKGQPGRPPRLAITALASRDPDDDAAKLKDLVSVNEAASLLPSVKEGKRFQASSVYRWIRQGKLSAVKMGAYWFVSRKELVAMFVPATVPTVPPPSTAAKTSDWATDYLQSIGV